MRRTVVLGWLIAAAVAGGSAEAQQPLSLRNASYTIVARLDPAARTIAGTETIVWRNITKTTATELQFHLYWNAWKHARTTWMRERALSGAPAPRPDEDAWSRIDVTSITLMAPRSVDLTSTQHFITPDEDASKG